VEFNKHIMENIKCNLCGSDNYKIVYPAKYDKITQQEFVEKFRSSGDELLLDQLVQCKNCKFKYINPHIKQELIIKGYNEGTDENFVSQAKGRELTFEKSLKLIEKHAKKGKILDIGTAGGSFLHVAKKRGWEVYGIEPNKWLCQWGKKNYGINIKQGTIFDNKFKNEYFDVITLWDVLEHVPDPTKNLNEINRILKTGSILVVNYPDIDSWLSKAMGKKWIFLLSVHLFYFNRKTIRKMLKKTGFKIVKIKPHFQTLGLGYLIFRMEKYNKPLSKFLEKFVKLLKLENFQIAYWLGQTLVISKKI